MHAMLATWYWEMGVYPYWDINNRSYPMPHYCFNYCERDKKKTLSYNTNVYWLSFIYWNSAPSFDLIIYLQGIG